MMRDAMTIRLTNRAIFVVLGLFALFWALQEARRVAIVLFAAVLLAAAVSSVANLLEARGVRRGITILVLYVLILATLAGVVALIVPVVTEEVDSVRRNLPAYEEQANAWLARIPREGEPLRVNDIANEFAGRLNAFYARAGTLATAAGSLLVTLIFILVVAYLLAADTLIAEKIAGRFVPPTHRPRALRMLSRIGDQLGNWMRAQIVLAGIFGVSFGLGLWALGVPFALTLGAVGIVLELIPYVGGLFAAVLAALVAATTGDVWRIVATVVLYVVIANVEANLITPRIMGGFVGLPPVIVLVSVFIGVNVIGGLGALLAVPLAIIVKVLLDEFWMFEELGSAGDEGRGEAVPVGEVPLD
ncbi:MAG: AI-2E family transporter [Thermomicrobiales bacterium]